MFAMQYKKIGAKIVYYRKIRGLTQEVLAERSGITPQYLSKIENGNYHNSVSLAILIKIAEQLNVTMAQLIVDIEKSED